MGGFDSFGLRDLSDNYLRYYGPGQACFLRIENVIPEDEANVSAVVELGFQPTVTGNQSGFTDVPIDPPPDVQEIRTQNVGLERARLSFSYRWFLISHTFVLNQMAAQGFSDPYDVFRHRSVVGFFYDNRLFSIEEITQDAFGGIPVLWKVLGQAVQKTSPADPNDDLGET